MLRLLVGLLLALPSNAYPGFRGGIPNGFSVPCPPGAAGCSAGICNGFGHQSCSGGGALNAFGSALRAANLRWTAALCRADSDGDGISNGAELGDPCCTWAVGQTLPTGALSHPGDASSKPPAGTVGCVNVTASAGQAVVPAVPAYFNAGEAQRTLMLQIPAVPIAAQATNYFIVPFAVPPEVRSGPVQLVGFNISVDKTANLHHIVMYQCSSDMVAQYGPFRGPDAYHMPDDCTVNYVWAPGPLSGIAAPPTAGYLLSNSTQSLAFSAHYSNPSLTVGLRDSTKVTMFYTPTLRQHNMRTLWTGGITRLFPPDGQMPPNKPAFFDTHACLVQSTSPVKTPATAVTAFLHAHMSGRRIWVDHFVLSPAAPHEVVKAGELGRDNAFSFEAQQAWPITGTLSDGDVISTTCVFNTTGRINVTRGGQASTDEMCIGFIAVYPDSVQCVDPTSATPLHGYVSLASGDFPLAPNGSALITDSRQLYGVTTRARGVMATAGQLQLVMSVASSLGAAAALRTMAAVVSASAGPSVDSTSTSTSTTTLPSPSNSTPAPVLASAAHPLLPPPPSPQPAQSGVAGLCSGMGLLIALSAVLVTLCDAL